MLPRGVTVSLDRGAFQPGVVELAGAQAFAGGMCDADFGGGQAFAVVQIEVAGVDVEVSDRQAQVRGIPHRRGIGLALDDEVAISQLDAVELAVAGVKDVDRLVPGLGAADGYAGDVLELDAV